MCYRSDMKINPANKNNINFQAIIISESIVRKKILKNLAEKELNNLKEILINQQTNPVNAFIRIDKNKLTASLHCEYRLKDFKENYRQIPFFESNLNFIKRVTKKCNEYRSQIDYML